MAGHALRARWGQPATGIFSFIVFFLIAWLTWFIFSDPRGSGRIFSLPLRHVPGDDDFSGALAAHVSGRLAFSGHAAAGQGDH